MKRSMIFTFSLLCMSICFGQQQKVRTKLSGTVTDAQTGRILSGASVLIADSRTGTVTDSTGSYTLMNIPLGHAIVEVSFSGYKTLVAHIDISNNDVHNFSLAPSVLENEGVTVTAVANATSIRKAPIPITRLSRTDLLASASTNIIDALSHQPGISQLATGPAISKPVIRGLGYNRLVVINDGIRQEGQQWGDEHGIEIDENSISRVEIVKGPASLIYGSDAIAGVINFITTSPLPVNTLRGNILASYQTNNRQRSLFANLGGNRNGFNWNVWGDYKAAADYRNRYDGPVYNSKFWEKNFGGYAGLNGSWGFTHLILSSFNQRVGIIEGERDSTTGVFVKPVSAGISTPVNTSDFEGTEADVPYQTINHLKIISDNSFKAGIGRITLNLGWQRNERKEFGDPEAPRLNSLYFDLQTFNYNAIYHFNEKRGWTSSFGLNGMAQENRNRATEVLIPEYHLFDVGSFIYLQKTVGRSSFSGGVRYDRRKLNSLPYVENGGIKFSAFRKNYSNFSASAGVSYSATDHFVLKLNLASGFRAPSIPELASNGAHEGANRYEYGDQRLQSERSLQADFGLELNSQHILLTANAFYNRINHFIFYSRLPGYNGADSLVEVDGDLIPAFQFNQRNAHLAGTELLIDFHPHPLDWLHWQNTFSYVRGLFEEPVEGIKNLPFIPAARWLSELRGEFFANGKKLRNLTAYFELDHTRRQRHAFTIYDTETATPAYTLLNAGISANIIRKNKVFMSVYLHANNLTDVAYQNHLSRLKYTARNVYTGRNGVYNMGRNFSIKLNIPFSF